MESLVIRSRQNALVKHARAVRTGRHSDEQIFIEGLRLAEEAVRSRLSVQDALYTERLAVEARGVQLLDNLKRAGARLSLVSEEVLDSISDTRTPQGIVLLATRPHTGRDALKTNDAATPLLVIIHGINNPANAGAILRTAEAAGATGLIATKGTTDIFSPKALRGAMGSSFRLPVWTGSEFAEVVAWCKGEEIRTLGAALAARGAHTEADWTKACALVVGSEAEGLATSEARTLDQLVRIPMRPPVESLNAAVASGIILYEAARQRKWVWCQVSGAG